VARAAAVKDGVVVALVLVAVSVSSGSSNANIACMYSAQLQHESDALHQSFVRMHQQHITAHTRLLKTLLNVKQPLRISHLYHSVTTSLVYALRG
jgi:hypothetical protein